MNRAGFPTHLPSGSTILGSMVLRIFLVEDSATIRDSLIETLQELLPAAVIGWAATEQEAIARLTQLQDQWDVALVDLFLLQGSGLGVVRAMKNRAPNQLLFVLSNYATQDMRQRSLHDGANAVFDKSTELDALLDRLQAAN